MQTLFSRSPWERPSVVSLRGPVLGQAADTCEPTPEGGQRCADGTYLPPGCGEGSPETVQGKPLVDDFPVIPVALALVGASAIGYYFLGNKRLGISPEAAETIAKIEDVAGSIKAERAADAWNHAQYVAKGKENYDLLYKEKAAEQNLVEQNRIWETAHRNFDALKAAEAEVETIRSQRAAVKAEADDFRARVEQNAQNVLNLRQKALYLIETLPQELQADARRTFDPCYQAGTMQGAFLGQVSLVNR